MGELFFPYPHHTHTYWKNWNICFGKQYDGELGEVTNVQYNSKIFLPSLKGKLFSSSVMLDYIILPSLLSIFLLTTYKLYAYTSNLLYTNIQSDLGCTYSEVYPTDFNQICSQISKLCVFYKTAFIYSSDVFYSIMMSLTHSLLFFLMCKTCWPVLLTRKRSQPNF